VSAKHRRQFYVFAAVAVVCSVVLATGLLSRSDGQRPPSRGKTPVEAGQTIAQSAGASSLKGPGRRHHHPGGLGSGTADVGFITPSELFGGALSTDDFAELMPGFDGHVGDHGDTDSGDTDNGDVAAVRPPEDPTGGTDEPEQPPSEPTPDGPTPEDPESTAPAEPTDTDETPGEDFSDLTTDAPGGGAPTGAPPGDTETGG
jgi:hypothetical protein